MKDSAETHEPRQSARNFWRRCDYPQGTPAAVYVARRGVPWLAQCNAIRFRADCPHPSRITAPAMVALIIDAHGNVGGVHRTFINFDGTKATHLDPVKATIGVMAGGAIRIHPPCPETVIGEGIETSASAATILGLPCWAGIAAGNIRKSLVLPDIVRRVVLAVDNDPAGRLAAYEAARRWRAEGRTVRFALPPEPHGDWNNALLARAGNG